MCQKKEPTANIDEKVAKAKRGSIISDNKGNSILINEDGTPVFLDPDKRDSSFD